MEVAVLEDIDLDKVLSDKVRLGGLALYNMEYSDSRAVNYEEESYGIIEPPTYDYGAFIKQYVNPNTKEVYEYKYDYESDKLIKENITTLDNL